MNARTRLALSAGRGLVLTGTAAGAQAATSAPLHGAARKPGAVESPALRCAPSAGHKAALR